MKLEWLKKLALADHNLIRLWLNELITFYDLVENRTGISSSKYKVKMFDYTFDARTNSLERVEVEVYEKDKYTFWFREIMEMIERNSLVKEISGTNPFLQKKLYK